MKKIDFEFESQFGVYRDALYLPDDHTFSNKDIDAMKTERLNKWIYVVENPPVQEHKTVEIDGIMYEKVEIDGQIVLKPIGV